MRLASIPSPIGPAGKRSCLAGAVAAALLALLGPAATPLAGQWVQTYEQFYLPASHNWAFRDNYRVPDRLFNAFDNAHNVLAEELWSSKAGAPTDRLERDEFDFIVNELLVKPPRLPLVEEAIGPSYARLVPEAKLMFEWAHLLHRQIYDVYADERVKDKQAAVDELMRYYTSRPDLAFATRPKSMELMEGQPYSLAFREKYPKFNGLIWAYHWMQVGLYEPLILGSTEAERQTGVTAAVARFWSMLEDAPANMPRMMPMTAAVAPEFTRRHPAAAAVFDNLHAMHDIISDILVSSVVPREKKREVILEALAKYRDDTTEVMTFDEWNEMAQSMGLENMGGRAVAILPPPPQGAPSGAAGHGPGGGGHGQRPPPAPAGAMEHGQPGGVQHGQPGAMEHGQPGGMERKDRTKPETPAPEDSLRTKEGPAPTHPHS